MAFRIDERDATTPTVSIRRKAKRADVVCDDVVSTNNNERTSRTSISVLYVPRPI